MLAIPRFKVHPDMHRMLVPKIVLLILLGILLYIGVYVNYLLLQKPVHSAALWIIVAFICILIILESILSYVRASTYAYTFYDGRLVMHERSTTDVSYDTIQSVRLETTLIDRMFRTNTITISLEHGKNIFLKYIKEGNQVCFFLQKRQRNL